MKWLQLIASLVVLAVLGWAFRDELDFLKDGLSTLRHADPWGILVVVLTTAGAITAMSEVMRLLIRYGGVNVPLRETSAVTLASNSWSTTLPAGPAFSAVLTFNVQRGWGCSVMLCGWFFVLSSAISTMWLVMIGLAGVLFLNADMAFWSLVSTLLLMLGLSAALFWLTNNPRRVEAWLNHQRLLKGTKREAVIKQVRNLEEVHVNRYQFSRVLVFSLLHRLLDMVSLWACVWAITGDIPALRAGEDQTTTAGIAIAYLTAKLAGSAQVTPAGLGTVEAAIIATLVAMGMTAVDATGAAIIYRLISFAAVTAVGWVVYFLHYARKGMTYAALSRKET
ncbi:lysylphosphatidylglycerol synthase transmembrane domain-containing protein [Corynebacterium flavescens]|uniref:lysylphosphatidylglycerol synthase transmembrane domain-containing protein n=1 Tax=Corynebacterium flavescens TaxID=28028 RepID=UPI003FD256D1